MIMMIPNYLFISIIGIVLTISLQEEFSKHTWILYDFVLHGILPFCTCTITFNRDVTTRGGYWHACKLPWVISTQEPVSNCMHHQFTVLTEKLIKLKVKHFHNF